MKSFDIFIDRRSIQSDLIVVNLPVRNDIAVYNWLEINSALINHIIAEKAMSPTPSGIALDARANVAIEKYEVVDAPIAVGADTEFKVLFPLTIDEGSLELEQTLQEVSKKIERVSLPVSVGTDDSVEVFPLKTVGSVDSIVEFETALNEPAFVFMVYMCLIPPLSSLVRLLMRNYHYNNSPIAEAPVGFCAHFLFAYNIVAYISALL